MDEQIDTTEQREAADETEARRELLQAFALARLERFAGLAAGTDDPAMRRLAQRATLTAYRDCRALGLHLEAARLLPVPPVSATR